MNIRKTTISSRKKQQNNFRQTRKEYPMKQKKKSKRNRKIKTQIHVYANIYNIDILTLTTHQEENNAK